MNSLPIDGIVVGERHRRDLGDIGELAASIAAVGLLHPIVVTSDNRLIAGERRLLACDKLGWAEVPVRVVDLDAVVLGEHAENELRKDFTASERVAIGRAVEPILTARHGSNQFARRDTDNGPSPQGETRNLAGQRAGFGSGKQYERAKSVVDHGDPGLVDAMDAGNVSVAGAALIAKRPIDEQQRIVAEGKLKEAVSDLRAAEKQMQEANQAPKAPLLSDQQQAEQRRLFGSQEDRVVAAVIHEVLDRISTQPEPAEAVRRIPATLRYAIDTQAVRAAAAWLNAFADEWEQEGYPDVQEAAE